MRSRPHGCRIEDVGLGIAGRRVVAAVSVVQPKTRSIKYRQKARTRLLVSTGLPQCLVGLLASQVLSYMELADVAATTPH